jgi:uncharacterized protein (TIGR00730 family)
MTNSPDDNQVKPFSTTPDAPTLDTDEQQQRAAEIMQSNSYLLADHDTVFMQREELRPVRMQLELLKPELLLIENDIQSTIVVFGGTKISEEQVAAKRLDRAKTQLESDPNSTRLKRNVSRAERVLAKSKYYEEARRFSALVSAACQNEGPCDYVIVTGGGPGIMEAANRGAFEVGAKSIGLNITLPAEQAPNAYITPGLCFQFRYFAMRKFHFILRAKALVIFPGGFGTLDELFDALTLRQTGRMQEIPIILVGRESGNLVHPDYNPAGIYSMANLTTQEASDHYRAVISFLAERYSRPDKEHGWITHWIVFNEVDYGWIWTNMGETPMASYMEAYEKAMRLTYIETRRFNPTAEVFISLTHSWAYSPADKFRAYPPRDLLDRMADYSALSGDYQWAIAYHPYPQSLLAPRTWEDSMATNDFDSRYVTPKNIEVLIAYLNQDQFLYTGKPRTIILSEQGYHTPDYSEQSMIDKAAAIAYTWEKILPLESVESFHYHRWVDHPLEGGLKVGLRTLPEAGKPYGVRKEPAFTVFSALETDAHEATAAPYKDVVGVESWDEIRITADEIRRN